MTDRRSWEQIKERLDPDAPGRLPQDWLDMCAQARESGETVYAGDLPTGFFGMVRELLGFEHQATLFYSLCRNRRARDEDFLWRGFRQQHPFFGEGCASARG